MASSPGTLTTMSVPIAGLLFLVTLATRLPFATSNLWAHDSVLYEHAIARFDPAAQSPQPPGYLWYVLLARGVTALTGDANAAMVLIAAFASAAAVALLYLFAARLFDERTARAAAVLLLTSVTFWGEGAVAYPYTLLAALTTGCALLFWLATGSDRERSAVAAETGTEGAHPAVAAGRSGRSFVLASLAWGLAVGFRTDLALFLAPLWLLAAYRVRSRAIVMAATAVVALAVLGWLAASAIASPDAAGFFAALAAQGRFVDETYSIAAGGATALGRNAYDLARYLGRALLAIAPLLALLAIPAVTRRAFAHRAPTRDRAPLFLALWTLAPLPVYLLVHIGEYGYVFSMLPGLCVAAARAAAGAGEALRRPATLAWLAGAATAVNAGVFLLAPAPLTAADLAKRDHGVDERLAALREMDQACTVVVTGYDALIVDRYLRGALPVLAYGPAETPTLARPLALALPRCRAGAAAVVLWDDLLRAGSGDWATSVMPRGALLRYAVVPLTTTLRIRDALTVDVGPDRP